MVSLSQPEHKYIAMVVNIIFIQIQAKHLQQEVTGNLGSSRVLTEDTFDTATVVSFIPAGTELVKDSNGKYYVSDNSHFTKRNFG